MNTTGTTPAGREGGSPDGRRSAQATAKNIVEAMLNAARAQLAETSEDSFATRCDLHRRIRDLTLAPAPAAVAVC